MAKRNGALPFDIALSFAGEDRKFASAIAQLLRSNGVKVFYDEYEKAQLWGKDLYQYLQEVYRDKAKFCVVIVSSHYLAKQWTRHELKQAQARAFAQTTEYILPLKLDTAELPGLTTTTGYIDAAKTPLPEIIRLILEKLGISGVDIEDRLRQAWDGEFVEYQGARMVSYWPEMIQIAQNDSFVHFQVNKARIPYGSESAFRRMRIKENCHDCAVRIGQFHVRGCDVEVCPNCLQQFISCSCMRAIDFHDNNMEEPILYGISSNSLVRRARTWLDKKGVEYYFNDCRILGVDRSFLTRCCDELGWQNILNHSSAIFRQLPESKKTGLSQAKAIVLMLERPTLIKLPLLEINKCLHVGFAPEMYERALESH